MSLTSVDLPEPLTPVTAVKHAERDRDVDVLQVVRARAADDELALERRPARLRASESSARRSGTRRSETRAAAPSPRISSAAACPERSRGRRDRRRRDRDRSRSPRRRMVSSSCSTTTTVLPRSRSRDSVPSSLRLSRWCRPIDGSSRHVQDAGQVGADLRRQPDSLAFAARQRRGAAAERADNRRRRRSGNADAPGSRGGSARR